MLTKIPFACIIIWADMFGWTLSGWDDVAIQHNSIVVNANAKIDAEESSGNCLLLPDMIVSDFIYRLRVK